ncbi:MAG: O-antigen ligase family protein [Pyrinomonadaceae bacterium]
MATHLEARPLSVTGDDLTRRVSARTARALDGAIFYVLLSLVVLAAVPYGTVHEWWDSLLQCVVFALAALWAFEGLGAGKWFVREHLLLAPLVPLLGFVFLQAVPLGRDEVAGVEVWRTLSADPYETRLTAFRFLAVILVAAMLLRYTSSPRRLDALVRVVVCVGVASALFGLARDAMQGDGEGFILSHLQAQIGYAQFVNNNHFAFLMEMCLGLLLGLAAGGVARRRGVRLLLCLSAAALVSTALVRSTSRGGIFSAVGQIVFIALLWGVASPLRRRQGSRKVAGARRRNGLPALGVRLALTACLLCVVGLCAVWVGGDKLRQRMETLRSEVGAQGAGNRDYPRRIEMWRATWEMIKEHPLGGAGFGGYWLAIHRHYDATGVSSPEQAHNDYLELLASGGIFALVVAALSAGIFIKLARDGLRSRDTFRRAACFGALTGLFGVALHSFVDFGLHITANQLVFTSLVVIAAAHVRKGERDRLDSAGRAEDRPARQSFKDGLSRTGGGRLARGVVVAVCLLVCPALMWATARAGLSRWHSVSYEREYSLGSAERAVRLSPHDPAARHFRAELLASNRMNNEASEEFRRAVALRPRAYFLWLRLGLVRESVGDTPGALAALEEGVRLAPFYAEPRWILGGALLRAGERERAFAEVSRAVASDPKFPPQTLEMLWEASGGDAFEMARGLSPQSAAARDALARFFVERGATDAAAALLRQTGGDGDGAR